MQCHIVLDSPTASYRPGEVIRRRVIVTTDRDRECERIVLRTVCRSSGRGTEEEGAAQQIALPGGRFAAGERRELPFQLPGPSWPASFSGTIVQLTWYVEARAVIPRGRDAVTAQPIRLEPAAPTLVIDALKHGDPRRVNAKGGYLRMLVWIALIIAGSVAATVHGLSNDAEYWGMTLAVGIIALIVGVVATIGQITTRKIGNVQTRVKQVGETLDVTTWLKPHPDIRKVEAKLLVLELAQRHHDGHAPEQHEHAIHEHAIALTPVAGRPGEYAGTLPLPAPSRVPYSIAWAYVQLAWRVVVRVELAGLPAEENLIRLRAAPAR